jgi:hypothetical protein
VLTHSTHHLFAKRNRACKREAARGEPDADRVEEAAAIRWLPLQRRTLEEHVLRANTGGMLLDPRSAFEQRKERLAAELARDESAQQVAEARAEQHVGHGRQACVESDHARRAACRAKV